MAITPLSSQAIPEITPIKGRNQSTAENSPNTSDSVDRKDLDAQIEETKSKSVRYQIIEKMMIKPEENAKNAPPKTSISPSNDSINISAASFASLSAEQQEIQQSNSGVTISQQSVEATSLSFSQEAGEVQKTDPLAFDLDGNGLQTSGIKNGIEFDIDGDGDKEQTSFVSGQDAFLAYDKNGNGVIDSGKELFGDQNGAANGYEELKKYDDNQDGLIDNKDAIYTKLKLMSIDENNQQKLSGLNESGIESINLNYSNTKEQINLYDSVEQTATFKKKDGTTGQTGDILLGHK